MLKLRHAFIAAAGLLAAAMQPAQAADKLTVVLDWFVNPDHAALVVAQEKGFFAEAGLDVELIAPADPNDPPKLLAAKKADLALGYQPQLQMQVGEGLPIVRVGTLVSTPLNSVVALADGPVKTIADLKGKKVGYSVAGFEDAILAAMLEKNGLSLKDVTLVNVNFTLSPAVIAGQVDAVIGAYRNFELNQMALDNHPGRAFYPEENGVPAYDELVLMAHKDRVKDAKLRRFVDAVEKATLYIQNHPEEAWYLFIKNHKDLNDTLNQRAWAATLPRLNAAPAGLDKARYERFAAFLKDSGLIKKVLPVEAYAVELPR
jgi:putative hydroxymethylpyrimidine transport system substrate-binding protein